MSSADHGDATATTLLRLLFDEGHRVAPHDLLPLVHRAAGALGATQTAIYLVDYARTRLIPLPDALAPAAQEQLAVDTTVAGTAFITQEVVVDDLSDGGLVHLWLPLLDGTERVGVLHLAVADPDEHRLWLAEQLATMVAELLVSKGRSGDLFTVVRRSRDLSLAAEMQWQLLPPMQIASGSVAIAGMLEPAYDVGGDAFDFAINGDTAHIAIFDAMGHGLSASVMCTVIVSAYRHARRSDRSLEETAEAMDEVFAEQFGGDRFVTAQFGVLDRTSGVLRWINAGHPCPLLVRGGRVEGPFACEPSLPIGFNEQGPRPVAEQQLEPGDRVFFYTDGMVEARDVEGAQFGLPRLVAALEKALEAGDLPNEILRRLSRAVLDHLDTPHPDDATVVMLEWQGSGQTGATGVTGGYPPPAAPEVGSPDD